MTLTFLTPWLLAGAGLVAIPILIHLILKKKPRHLLFPAFRFLQEKQRTNLQKLRLRHLLLLAMRVLLILIICAALARPLVSGGPAELATDAPLAVILVFDTSPSMEYEHEGKTRLEDAKERAARFLDGLPAASQVAVVDTAESGVQFVAVRDAQALVKNRRPRAYNRPVTSSLEDVFRSLEKSPPDLPLFLVIFSDRTAGSWSAEAVNAYLASARQRLMERLKRPLPAAYFDLSPPEPRNVSLVGLGLRQAGSDTALPLESLPFGASSREPVQLQATVQVTGMAVDNELTLLMDGVPLETRRLRVQAQPAQAVNEVVTFKPVKLTGNLHQGEVRLKNRDLLDADNVRYWTLAATKRQVLVVTDRPTEGERQGDDFDWAVALESLGSLPVSVKVVRPKEVPSVLHPDHYQAVVLMNVAQPGADLWQTLHQYVTAGGGLVILPGDDSDPDAYRSDAAMALMPCRLLGKATAPPPGATFAPTDYDHPIMAPFKAWEKRTLPGRVFKYWQVEKNPATGLTVLPYSIDGRPAILERVFDPQKVRGRVILFTTAMYRRPERSWRDWNNLGTEASWMYLAFAYLSTRHVLGAREERQNFHLGGEIRFWLPRGPGFSSYSLYGPETATGEVKQGESQLLVTDARRPGNYRLSDPGGRVWQRAFSVNLPPSETQLLSGRPSPGEIEGLLGSGSFHALADAPELRDVTRALLGQSPQTELLPWLMIGVLLLLAGENWLANRFYRKDPDAT
jgi:hypothetical protein